MNEISLSFAFDSDAIRVVGTPEEPLFVGSDVASALGFSHAPSAYRSLDDDEKGVQKVYTPGGEQEMTVITESGLYSLILRSNKPEAKVFKRWVTHEVLPSIRKTGQYKVEDLKQEIKQLEGARGTNARQIVRLYKQNIFGSDHQLFKQSQLYWRIWYYRGSYSAVARVMGTTSSRVSSRVKKYRHYLDATRFERDYLPANSDGMTGLELRRKLHYQYDVYKMLEDGLDIDTPAAYCMNHSDHETPTLPPAYDAYRS